MAESADYDALVERVAGDLLETDALTPNHNGTPEHYIVDAENVGYLVRTVLDFARPIPPAETDAEPSRVQAIEAAEDHADQVAFDSWRERGL